MNTDKQTDAAAPPMLTLKDVHTEVDGYHILQGVSFSVPRHQVTMLLGRNGVGKTSTLRTIMGLWRASRGTIALDGENIESQSTMNIARKGLHYVPENMGIFASLTVGENLRIACRSQRLEGERLDWVLQLFPAMHTFWHWPAGNLSGGQKQMLAIARAVIEPCDLLLVDEPSKGLAPAIIQNLMQAFEALKAEQTTILMVEQNLHMARRLGDHVVVMEDGRTLHEGSMAEFAADSKRQAEWLGLSMEASV
ncbi:ABC transporter ATP-binding protein [Saccharospirillum sp.]|uniref:ABC transporter ATP-binding protein n=1 Tax=Saccharospirillum sp. TaxID=2033801 RepID=UPI0034A09C4E